MCGVEAIKCGVKANCWNCVAKWVFCVMFVWIVCGALVCSRHECVCGSWCVVVCGLCVVCVWVCVLFVCVVCVCVLCMYVSVVWVGGCLVVEWLGGCGRGWWDLALVSAMFAWCVCVCALRVCLQLVALTNSRFLVRPAPRNQS